MKTEEGHEMEVVSLPAYWHEKKRWVWVPLFHLPPDAVGENGETRSYKFILSDGQKIEPIPKRTTHAEIIISESIVPTLWLPKKLKLICRRNDIEVSWVAGHSLRKKGKSGKNIRRRENRKIKVLTSEEFRDVIREGKKDKSKSSKQTILFARILWFLNKSLGKGGSFNTSEELLRLKFDGVAPDLSYPNWIRLRRKGYKGDHLTIHYLPQGLWKDLCKQIRDDQIFVFCNKYGGPILLGQIDAQLKKFGKKAGIKKVVTSASLRPLINEEKIRYSIKKICKDASPTDHLDPVSLKEWKQISKSIPLLSNKTGRKSIYHPRDILNGILYHLKNKCPFQKLPKSFPPFEAIDSQYRRWKKNGVFEEIIKFQKTKTSF